MYELIKSSLSTYAFVAAVFGLWSLLVIYGMLKKTKDMKNAFDKLGWTSALILGGAELDKNFALASGNIVGIDVLADAGANVYDILRRDTLVLTKETVSYLEALLK